MPVEKMLYEEYRIWAFWYLNVPLSGFPLCTKENKVDLSGVEILLWNVYEE